MWGFRDRWMGGLFICLRRRTWRALRARWGSPRAMTRLTIYLASPEYMASFTRKLMKAGASIVGGCCGTTPSYTRAMRSYLRAMDAMDSGGLVMERAGSTKS